MTEKNVGGVPTSDMTGIIESDGPKAKLPHASTTDNAHAVGQLRLLVATVAQYKKAGLVQKRSQYFDELETAIERCAQFLDLPPENRGELPTPLGWQTSTTMQLSRGYDPSIMFWSNTIPTILGDFSPAEALAYIEREWQRVADAAGYGWSNTHWKFNDGFAYSESAFQLYVRDGVGELHAWDQKGRALGTWTLSPTDKEQRHAAVDKMLELSKQANRGKYRCSRCGVVFPDPPAGQYFAGVYCGPCWEKPGEKGAPSPKTRESRETYS